jgi:hypothetical protein
MNDLTVQPENEPPERQITLALSPGLKSLLTTSEMADDEAAQALAMSPHMGEARMNLPALSNRARLPAGESGVREIIGKALASYPQPDRNEAEWAAWWEPYFALCGDLPPMALRLAMLEHMKGPDRAWLPKAGDLRALAQKVRTPAAVAVARIRKAAEIERSGSYRRPARAGAPTKEEREQMREMADRLVAELAAKKPPTPVRPPPQGALAPGAPITPQMQELLRRQGMRNAA